MIKTLSDAVAIVEFLISRQGKSVRNAIVEANIPLHLREQVEKYFAPPIEIVQPDLLIGNIQQIPRCDPTTDSIQQYFGALQRFLIEERFRNKSVVDSLARTSLDLVRRFPKPDAVNEFQDRGLVVGHIQSGKTAMIAALIARAADEGYKLFIVFGGLWKDLRAQTQRRLDQEITGDSEFSTDGPFVKHDEGVLPWTRLTQSGLNGDFRAGTTSELNPLMPKIAVIKKNKRVESLCHWLERAHISLKDLPAVVIDDEADQGSINTNYGRTDDDGEPVDPSATNRRIRELLSILPKYVYVGFTATPFANVLIDAAEDDLYPKDFIATLPEPPGYFGPRKLFGLGMSPSDLSPEEQEKPLLDVIRYVEDEELDEIDRALNTRGSGIKPTILTKSLLAFILSCCARMARGDEKEHFSMLIHPSQRTEAHRIFAGAITEELEFLREVAARPSKFPDIMRQAREMWETDFQRVTKEQNDNNLDKFDFDTIWKFSKHLTESIEIKVLNTRSRDKLEYTAGPKRYIVVGGNRLSRGLTLEGLSISLFTRNADQYDTLLQMGRWFGYRPKYYDLTRIFVNKDLAERFAELARVEDELRADLQKYSQQPNPPTPLDLMPRIRSHPTMAVTARLKMGAGKPVSISFENTTQQTVSFPVENKALLKNNLDAGLALIRSLPENLMSEGKEGMHVWKDIEVNKVIEFLDSYAFSTEAINVNRQNIVNYIKRQNDCQELVYWDIVLPSGSHRQRIYPWNKRIFTRCVERKPITTKSIGVLSDPNDIARWRRMTARDPKNPEHGCIMFYLIDKESCSKKGISFFKNPSEAEDILGLVFVFPESQSHQTIAYISQNSLHQT